MRYRSEATSVAGFVQQIACCYLRHGYWWYVTGYIPDGKDRHLVDHKLIEKYGIAVSESTRARRKQKGLANLQYLRYGAFFVLLATRGRHTFFEEEAACIRDIRRCPLKFASYSISYRRGGRTRAGDIDPRRHAHVEIERRKYLEIRAHFLDLAVHRSADRVALAFYQLPFEPYAPIRRQFLRLLRDVNQVRQQAGFRKIPTEILPLRRRVVKPFRRDGINSRHELASDPAALAGP